MYFFMNAYARTSKYVTEIRRRDPLSGHVTPAPLIEAVAIEASWAGMAVTYNSRPRSTRSTRSHFVLHLFLMHAVNYARDCAFAHPPSSRATLAGRVVAAPPVL